MIPLTTLYITQVRLWMVDDKRYCRPSIGPTKKGQAISSRSKSHLKVYRGKVDNVHAASTTSFTRESRNKILLVVGFPLSVASNLPAWFERFFY